MRGHHPAIGPDDFTIVEDTTTGAVVSSLNLVSQIWTYGGTKFGLGRIEMVGTLPEYRRRGLIRAQVEEVHRWSRDRGEQVQGITGIPWYYRQFGYEMALEHLGSRSGQVANVSSLRPGESEVYHLRPATVEDVPFITRTYTEVSRRNMVACVLDEPMWRYFLTAPGHKTSHHEEVRVMQTAAGEPVGFIMHAPALSGADLSASVIELSPGVSWKDATASVVRYLERTGREYAERDNAQSFRTVTFDLGSRHPAYDAADRWLPTAVRPYAWYMRVTDLPGFIRLVAPVLERRLAGSPAAGHTGDLKLNFILGGLRLSFERGCLADAEEWTPTQADSRLAPRVRDALFPALTFLQLLFGNRSVDDLEYAFPDCLISSGRARELLNILFPKQPAKVWGVE
jgi:GNAT superfamily N-acetyltransferase